MVWTDLVYWLLVVREHTTVPEMAFERHQAQPFDDIERGAHRAAVAALE